MRPPVGSATISINLFRKAGSESAEALRFQLEGYLIPNRVRITGPPPESKARHGGIQWPRAATLRSQQGYASRRTSP